MNKKLYPISTITKYHIFIGLLLGVWIFMFLVLIAPFDTATVRLENRMKMMPMYGVIFASSYMLWIVLENRFSNILPNKSIKLESIVAGFMTGINLLPVYLYYTSNFIQGEYSFLPFILQIYLPVLLLVLPMLAVMRWFVAKQSVEEEKVTVIGKGKYDKIKLRPSQIVYVKGADNYVEIYFLENQELTQKLIRYTLKEIKQDVPELVQSHRSFLINPTHFVGWKNRNTISLTLSQVPVSDTYRKRLPELI